MAMLGSADEIDEIQATLLRALARARRSDAWIESMSGPVLNMPGSPPLAGSRAGPRLARLYVLY